jgi:hypothetical protein
MISKSPFDQTYPKLAVHTPPNLMREGNTQLARSQKGGLLIVRVLTIHQWGLFLVWTLSMGLYGCGSTLVPLTITEETAIYTATFERVGKDRIHAIVPTTNTGGFSEGRNADDCAGLQTVLVSHMPMIIPDIIPAFCQTNEISRPVNVEVIQQLGLEIRDFEQGNTIRLSSIQTDAAKSQALVFVQVQDGDFAREVYLLLIQKDGKWSVRAEF